MDIVLEVLLNPIKQFDLETCWLISLLNSSFELNYVEAYLKWIIQFNRFQDNLYDQ